MTMAVIGEVAELGLELIEAGRDLIRANQQGDAEAERRAILRANRATSDALAKREASSPTEPPATLPGT